VRRAVRVRLGRVEIDEESGRGAITIRGRRGEFELHRETFESLREVLGERGLERLLRTIDSDLGRYEDVVSVIEELAEHVFRGRMQTRLSLPYGIAHTIDVWGLRGSVETIFDYDMQIIAERYGGPRRVEYEAGIRLENGVAGGEEDAARLLALFFDELAGILGVPEVRKLKKERYTSVELYENRRRFRGV
jgi:hypothetical protein